MADVDEFNADELQPPRWLNDEFFVKVLRHCEKEATTLKLIRTKHSPASKKGDHYASAMFRVAVDYEVNDVSKSRSLIIKTMHKLEGYKKEILSETNIFETEIGMYTEVLPRLEKILRDVGDDTVLKAPCLYCSLSPQKVIILEDIVPLGYEVLRDRFVTIEEAKAIYAKLAKLHATSYKIIKEEPECFAKYRDGFFGLPNFKEDKFLTNGIHNFIDFLKATPTLQQYLPYFESISNDLLQKCVESFKEYQNAPKEDVYYALCHGDFHFKNLMYKHNPDTGKLDDVMLLDYQISYVGPIVNDLLYSRYLLLDRELRKVFPEIVHHYFTVFKTTLEKIGFEGELPRLVRLREQLLEYKYFEFFMVSSFLPLVYALLDPKTDWNEMMISNDYRRKLYENKLFQDELHELLPKYLRLGYLED